MWIIYLTLYEVYMLVKEYDKVGIIFNVNSDFTPILWFDILIMVNYNSEQVCK